MLMLGAPACMPEGVTDAIASACAAGHAFVVFSDGDDLMCVFGEAGDTVETVQAMASRSMPWGAS